MDSRPPAAVHVDLDGSDVIFAAHGWRHTGKDVIYRSGLESALTFFEEHDIKATLFAIAKDLDDPDKLSLLQSAVEAGHEIASHTWTHRKLGLVPSPERTREISDSRKALEDRLGTPVTGFRAPGFDLDASGLEQILTAGYRFDSSLFGGNPNPLGGTAPDTPFPLRGVGGALELPLPPYRPWPVPWHASYSLVLGRLYFGAGLQRFRRSGRPLIMLCHLTDFADPEPLARGLKQRVFTLSFLSRAAKMRRMAWMFGEVKKRYRVVSTAELLGANGADGASPD